ncbi:COX15/CtaA family protein [Oharaeibacter diazotrophicus]|uniref:Heme A synthase n=1 Tax=Oharaeibacter diazotrophicus TaxID=1920512 RepID=A0A4R6RJC0_9HYPH|nr:COX15/CtaA family protein [Oharaeibacter diazotrophicus]TDP86560.1 cytochrome c oxidase assembly protein subunit 15 [Oharaeibacter diazotrophicus]BBE71498.1 heme A synthase [Pleomorphomonas sp. SM30]GLS78259.1 heme A synthase [Oharaeibacter diazotrophicus]
MSSVTALRAPAPVPAVHHRRGEAAVRAWLWVVAVMIIGMVVVGGATRLTQSGLSITEWKPIHGVIPPLSAAEWAEEFAKYQRIPEYREINRGMSLDDFKFIFWWEWSHRLLGRVIGVVFLVPFVAFAAAGWIRRDMLPRIGALFLLGGLQGAVGWWMVASGLVERTDVSQYRLATHLTLACFILVATVWTAESLRAERSRLAEIPRLVGWSKLLVVAVLVQIFLGGLVAGLDAGYVYNTWPLMEGRLVPDGLWFLSPWWLNFFENHLTVQFVHRCGAYLVLALAVVHALDARREALDPATERRALLVAALVSAQAAVGVATLLAVVPLSLGLAHQFMAVVVLTAATVHARRTADGGRTG